MKEMPQELEVWYVIPGLRRELVLAMKKQGLSQKKIAEILKLTEPAVSQYVRLKRAMHMKFSVDIKKEIDKSSKRITGGTNDAMTEVQRLCKLIKDKGALCTLHKKREKVPSGCSVCMDI